MPLLDGRFIEIAFVSSFGQHEYVNQKHDVHVLLAYIKEIRHYSVYPIPPYISDLGRVIYM